MNCGHPIAASITFTQPKLSLHPIQFNQQQTPNPFCVMKTLYLALIAATAVFLSSCGHTHATGSAHGSGSVSGSGSFSTSGSN
jgi:hypothetical protein